MININIYQSFTHQAAECLGYSLSFYNKSWMLEDLRG